MINIKEGKQAGPTNPNYENLKLQIKSVIKKKKKRKINAKLTRVWQISEREINYKIR